VGVTDEHIAAIERDLTAELERQAQLILDASNREIPVGDPAEDPDQAVDLAASGRVVMDVTPLTGRVVAYITYDTDYAVKQHESLHLRHPRGGGPHFLENALLEHARNVAPAIAAKLQASTRSGRTRQRSS
jgi:hypothetical protein